jgi:hypothetical protein
MWARYRINVLKAFASGRFANDTDAAAEFIADQFDKAIKSGGDFIYGVPVLNANKKGFADVLKRAFKKGQRSDGENFNLLKEICPSAFDAYWMGAEMSPFPNPLIKPLGWVMTPPSPGAVMNISPNPISLAQSAATNKILAAAALVVLKALETIELEDTECGKFKPFEVATKLSKGKKVPTHLAKLPAVIAAKEAISLYKVLKDRKPSIGPQFKPSIKIPFPPLPKRKDIIKKLTDKLKEEAKKELKKQLEETAKEFVITAITTEFMTKLQNHNK